LGVVGIDKSAYRVGVCFGSLTASEAVLRPQELAVAARPAYSAQGMVFNAQRLSGYFSLNCPGNSPSTVWSFVAL
jgi:hypothetical protein